MTPSIRVVIIEDDDDVAGLHARFLESLEEFEVVGRAGTVAQAFGLLEELQPELLLLDLHLPDGTGMDLLRRVRAVRPDAYDIIMITAVPDRPIVERALRLGVSDYLLKPFTKQEFTKRLRAYARARNARRLAPTRRPLTQADIDALRDPNSSERTMPKGLAPATNELVVAAMRAAGRPVTASEIGAEVGMSRVSARRYLEQLTRDGRVTARPRYGEPGRPQLEYAWVE